MNLILWPLSALHATGLYQLRPGRSPRQLAMAAPAYVMARGPRFVALSGDNNLRSGTASLVRAVRGFVGTTLSNLPSSTPYLPALVLLPLLSLSAVAMQRAAVVLPFKTAGGLMVVTVKVNNKPVSMVVDTGAVSTFVSAEAAGVSNPQLGDLRKNKNSVVISGKAAVRNVTLEVGNSLFNQYVTVLSLKELSDRLGVRCGGILGEDFLTNFRWVTVDYKVHQIELVQ